MERVKESDPIAYEIINFLGKSYHENGKIDLRELPSFIAIYGPEKKETGKLRKLLGRKMNDYKPILDKSRRIGKQLPLPIGRSITSKLRQSFLDLSKVKGNIEKLDDSVTDQLLSQSPEWMKPLSELMKDLKTELDDVIKKRKGMRVSRYPKEKPTYTKRWPLR